MNTAILVVDDEKDFLATLKRGLVVSGYKDLGLFDDPIAAVRSVEAGDAYDIALLDITMPNLNGLELLDRIKAVSPDTECIMITAVNEVAVAVRCMQKGAYDYLLKPVLHEDLIARIERALEKKRLVEIIEVKTSFSPPVLNNAEAFGDICTNSLTVQKTLKEAELHAMSDLPVLITGESGTGKELLARAIHKASTRAKSPFVAINMASMSETLFEAEFFGHTKGAFTGAERERSGHLANAHKGTLFLDEIGNLPSNLQGKLLRVLQEGEFMMVGSSKLQKIDIRFIAATNEDLERLMTKGLFRKDLYYRLRGAWLHLPPLRERQDDIPLLINRFIQELDPERRPKAIEQEALNLLLGYDYPGNIRELRSIVLGAANLAQGGSVSVTTLPACFRELKPRPVKSPVPSELSTDSLADVEKQHILSIYESTGCNKARTAQHLRIGLNTLRRKLESYGIS